MSGETARHPPIHYPAAWIRQISAGVVARGHDLARHLSGLGLDPEKDAYTRGEMVLVTVANGNLLDDEALGLIPCRVAPGALALRVGTMMTCPTLRAGIMVSNHLTTVTRAPVLIRFETESDQVRLVVRVRNEDSVGARVLEEVTLLAMFVLISWLVGRLITATSLATRVEDYPFLGVRHPLLNLVTRLGDETSLTFPLEVLDWPIVAPVTSEPIWDSISWYELAMSNRVEGECVRILGQTIPLDELASLRLEESLPRADVGERQVRRRLIAELGKSFRDVKHDMMVTIAQELLSGTDLTLDEIAARLGYLEPRSFRRFIKSQTGLTPSQLRAAGRPQPVEPNPDIQRQVKAQVRFMELDPDLEVRPPADPLPLRETG